MRLKKLLAEIKDIEVKGSREVEVTGLCNHSKMAAPGFLFFAKKAKGSSESQFSHEAVLGGASVIVTDLFDPFLPKVTQVISANVADLEVILAQRFYENPSGSLFTVGITGTNGKTTCAYLIKHALDALNRPAGLIGTVGYLIKDVVLPSLHTTPDLLTNQKLLREMVVRGCESVVMEVSSHAIHQKRVEGIDFDVAIFTNLTQDHLDYHKSMQEYARVKAELFSQVKPSSKKYFKSVVMNIDSPWASLMCEKVSVPVITYGFSMEADLRVEDLKLSPQGSSCSISYQGEKRSFMTSLIGKFNIYNCLAAIGCLVSQGIDFSKALALLSTFQTVRGRMERVETIGKQNIFVDYAHTEDALKNVLETLREVIVGRIVCVFGCGGDRDKLKRPKMGSIAEKLADQVVVTSDNPRSEVPEEIIEEILLGVQDREKVQVEVDREKAIAMAISYLGPSDALLIAGKGHENYQIFSHHTIHFDDRIVAKEYAH